MRRIRDKAILLLVGIGVAVSGAATAGEVHKITEIKNRTVRGTAERAGVNVILGGRKLPALDDAGASIYVNASYNDLGTNVGHAFQVFGYDCSTGLGQQLTFFPRGVGDGPQVVSVSDDDQWLAVIAPADPVGLNHDLSPELFVMDTGGSNTSQITSDPGPSAGSVRLAMISGDGSRVAFVANADPLGTNPGNHEQLFIVDRDGQHLAQLTTSTAGKFDAISVNDDASRLVFTHDGDLTGGNADGSFELYAIEGGGANLRRITSTTTGNYLTPMISGNGIRIVTAFRLDSTGSNQVWKYEWDGSGALRLATFGDTPSITDDGVFVFYDGSGTSGLGIYRIRSDGAGLTQVVADSNPASLRSSGSGNRVGYLSNSQFWVVNSTGGEEFTLIGDSLEKYANWPEISADGQWLAFTSNANVPLPGTGVHMYAVRFDGSDLFQVSSVFTDPPELFPVNDKPTISSDGSFIAFQSSTNTNGLNPDRHFDLFRINRNGTGLQRLTFSSVDGEYILAPQISDDDSKITFYARSNLLGAYTETFAGVVYCMNSDGTGLALLTPNPSIKGASFSPRLDATGNWVVFPSFDDLVPGMNPDKSLEIFRAHCDGSGLEQLTSDPSSSGFSFLPDIDGAGDRIVFVSTTDPLGTNPDGNFEVFLLEPATSVLTQLTVTTGGQTYTPRISNDGQWVWFVSSVQFTDDDPDYHYDLFRMHVATGTIVRAGGLGPGDVDVYANFNNGFSISADGTRAGFSGLGNFTDHNADLWQEVWAEDVATPETIHVSGRAATTLSWDVTPEALRYDVIRGDVSQLAAGVGGTVDLGVVVCVEDDSPDAHTVGFEDVETPAPGQAFYYVFRGSQGLLAGPGSYGQATDGAERVAGAGDCAP